MPTVEHALAWLVALPALALYASAFGFAFVENIFPPLPADAFIGLCAFVAGPGDAVIALVFASVIAGNLSSAVLTYVLGRRYGARGLHKRLEARGLADREKKMSAMYKRYGLVALFLGRLVPGVRPIVPLLAGALRVPPGRTFAMVGLASVLWYGTIIGLAYRVGDNWKAYSDQLATIGRWGAGAGVVFAVVAIGAGIWFFRKRHHAE